MSLPIKITLPENFLEKEVRCGYEVSEKLKKIWAVELDLLAEFDRVCQKYDIKYQVFAGTLLGAVRHGGFIPWDDDLDVAMSRKEYNKLCAIACSEFKYPYFFQTALSDTKRYLPFARLRNSQTTGVVICDSVSGYNNGIYIDIHPLDGKPRSRLLQLIHRVVMKMLRKCCTTYNDTGSKSKRAKVLAFLMRPIVRSFPFSFWCRVHDLVISCFNVDKVGMLTHFEFGDKYELSRKDLANCVFHQFEMLRVPIPKDYDKVLRGIYGDYLKLPEINDRGKWHDGIIHFEPDIPYQEYLRKKR